jgi:type I restriction enzyme S subunit
MELKPGFRPTEIGVFPDEWEISTLENIARIIDPQPDHRTPPEAVGGEPYIGISDFSNDKTVNWDSSRKIVKKAVDKQQLSFQIRPGDIIFGKIGTIGQPKFIPSVPFRFALSANVLLIQPSIEPQFVMAWFESLVCQTAIKSELHSTSQAAFGINKMRRLLIPLPSKDEQCVIAEALSDANALIESLEQLVAKKRQIKQGAMQELLTGKKRLPGFSGNWVARRLGDECELVTKGTTPTSIGRYFTDSGVKFIKVESLDSSGRIIDDKVAFIDEETNKLLKRSQLKEGDLLVSIAGALGRVGIVDKSILPANTNQALGIARLKFDAHLHLLYLLYFLRLEKIKKHIEGISVQGAQANLSLQNIADLPVDAPDIDEQTAIATILSEMDTEVTELETKLAKARSVKQGMMQQLLTGRIRLV